MITNNGICTERNAFPAITTLSVLLTESPNAKTTFSYAMQKLSNGSNRTGKMINFCKNTSCTGTNAPTADAKRM